VLGPTLPLGLPVPELGDGTALVVIDWLEAVLFGDENGGMLKGDGPDDL